MQREIPEISMWRRLAVLTGLLFVPCAYGQVTLTCSAGANPARVGTAYSLRCAAAGGTAPYTFGLRAGAAMPAGLALAPSGAEMEIRGTPTQAGSYTFGVLVQDAANPRRETSYTFTMAVARVAGSGLPVRVGVITTYAGTDWVFPATGVRAVDAPLGEAIGVVVDAEGNPIIADARNCIVARIEKDGGFTVLAGNGVCRGVSSGDGGPAVDAALDLPSGLGIAPNGDLYVITAHQIRRISGGIIRTVASYPYLAGEFYPRGNIAIDENRNLFVPDYWNHRILKFTPNDAAGNSYKMELYAGETGKAGNALGQFHYPRGVTLDKAGNLYVAELFSYRVQKISRNKEFSTEVSDLVDPGAVKIDAAGNLIIAAGCGIFRAAPGQARAELIAGVRGDDCGYRGDGGPALQARLNEFLDIALDGAGNIYVADIQRVRKIANFGTVTTIAGNGKFRLSPDGTHRLDAVLNTPTSLAVQPNRDFSLYLGEDGLSNKVRRIDSNGVTTVAGRGDKGASVDGTPALSTPMGTPLGLAFDATGLLYISDWDRFCWCIRRLNADGTLTKFTKGSLYGARGLAFDIAGNLYAAASGWGGTSKVYKVFPTGQVSDFPGGPGSNTLFGYPIATAVDAAGNVYVGDNGRVWRVSANGDRSIFAGGGFTDNDGVPATQAAFGQVTGMVFDREGSLFLSAPSNGSWKVKKITPSGIISTVAGGAPIDQMGDGKIATAASLNGPAGLAFDEAGNLYVADRLNHRIRTVLSNAPALQVSTPNLTFAAPSGGAKVTQTVSVFSNEVAGLEFGLAISGAPWLSVEAGPYASPRLLTFTADPKSLPSNGVYSALITITPVAATPSSLVIPVVFNVGPARERQLSVSATDVSFAMSRNSTPQTSRLQVSNVGGQVLTYSVSKAPASATWLSAVGEPLQASPGEPSTLRLTANPAGLDAGVYAATLTIGSNGGTATVKVVMAVSAVRQTVVLSQTGLSYTAVAGGGVIPPQTAGVINTGEGRMDWEAGATTTAGGNWLSVSPARGSSEAGKVAPQITIAVNPPADMKPGNYYGTVRVAAPGSANRARLLTVFLRVLNAGTPVAAVVQPAELVFRTTPDGGAPGSQVLEVYGINANAKTFRSVRSGGNFNIFPLPGSGTLDPRKPTRVLVQPVGRFPAGTHSGEITFQFIDGTNGNVQVVKTKVISAAAVPVATGGGPGRGTTALTAPCQAKNLEVTVTSLAQSFVVSAGWPVGLRVKVLDDCNVPLGRGEGTVVARFDGTGEDEVSLTPLGDGTWDGTWVPAKSRQGMQMTIRAKRDTILGEKVLGGDAGEAASRPEISKDSIANYYSAGRVGITAMAPGGFLSIYPSPSALPRLADYEETRGVPFTTAPLGNAQVFFDRTAAPMQMASPGRINVLVPFDLPLNTETQIRIKRGDALSLPVDFTVAVAQPSVYQVDGTTYAYNTRTAAPVSATAPAKPGDVLTIYVIGLGITAQELADGSLAPDRPLAEVEGISVQVGGRPATVTFAGRTPRSVGLYQINFEMPAGVQGPTAALTIRSKEQVSEAVSVAVQ